MGRIWGWKDDPLAFAKYVYPWGQEGTPLWDKQLRTWQIDLLEEIKQHCTDNFFRKELLLTPKIFKKSVSSGHGIGKGVILSILTNWHMSTHVGSTTITAANNESQLRTRTWAEIARWNTMSINRDWWHLDGMSMRPAGWFAKALSQQLMLDSQFYYAQGQLWTKDNPDAFAGSHNQNGMMVGFDEGSGIHHKIWDIVDGFFTEPTMYRLWLVFSNPRRTTGRFFETHHRDKVEWRALSVDSRTVEGTDKDYLNALAKKHGENSDKIKVQVRGLFPSTGENQAISRELIDLATMRDKVQDQYAPLIMGVDPARQGKNETVIYFRQGRDAWSIAPIRFNEKDAMVTAARIAQQIDEKDPDAVAMDGTGLGGPIVDRVREKGYKVTEIQMSSAPINEKWKDKRTELWMLMKEWLDTGYMILDSDLVEQLAAPEIHELPDGRMKLESKEDLKGRGIDSPDIADALSCTFGVKVAPRDLTAVRAYQTGMSKKKNVRRCKGLGVLAGF